MNKQFYIEYLGTTEFKQRLEAVALPYTGNLRPINNTLSALQHPPLSCKTVVFEYDYVDKDYQNEFSAFYSLSFKKYPHRCNRLHFFADAIPQTVTTEFGNYRDSYLGFMVIRPTDLQRMGRTILRPTTLTDPDRQFIHCLAKFEAHILGETFTVEAMPFTQQDTQVGACAQASLWMLARYMSRRFGYREYLPAEINQFAKAHLAMGRAFPAERGLNFLQILDALQGMGFSALNYSRDAVDDCSEHINTAFPAPDQPSTDPEKQAKEKQRTAKLADIAYRYIESGLPVILGTSNHAVVGIGHTYDPTAMASVAIQRIPAFFINNDNTGPYLEMPLFASMPTPVPPGYVCFLMVQTVIVVLPHEVSLRGEEAEIMASTCVEKFLKRKLTPTDAKTYRDWITADLRPDLAGCLSNLEYRTFLRPSVEFQADLRQDIKDGRLDCAVGEKILCLDYPKYIWITEVSSSAFLNKAKRQERQCLGRVIIDSTAPAKTGGEIVIHFADFLRILDRQGAEKEILDHYPKTTPFAHKLLST
jgi:hypothetical protein